MELALTSTAARRALLIAAVAIAAIMGLEVGKHWIADDRIQSEQLASMKRGAALEPDNAEAWDRIGRLEQYDFANPDPWQAVVDYLKAVRNNPHSEHYCMDLASAYEMTGDVVRAREASPPSQRRISGLSISLRQYWRPIPDFGSGSAGRRNFSAALD